eukprot:CAMPEP_0176479354 /NCGR_PEP_ID=MMETSP0200_2-20121128/1695_1 /TAXON_ID=947934 /ORGANISM="Chaetoceros sp., Strain GSL56" /LENGTH=252 /DNA_ID=CAMNT_0017875393 /DNA_START=521 /DNA_END=1279 /DNA_ORIENTATION=-
MNSSSNRASTWTIIQLMNTSTRGMGRGAVDRMDGWYQSTYLTTSPDNTMIGASNTPTQQDSFSMRDIPSYNEIMLQHRETRIPLWKKNVMQEDVSDAVNGVLEALVSLQELKILAQDYEWDDMQSILRGPVLTWKLQESCSILQQARGFLSIDARQEIGFDWGSCAWRKCGAQADAQESLAELYNAIGLFEPFECLFTIDIVERSLRDILAVIPPDYKPSEEVIVQRTGEYVPYEPRNNPSDGGNNEMIWII